MQFANNFGKLVEVSSHDFWDVVSIKNVEGMRIFTRFAKTLVSKDPRVCNSGSFSEQFLKKDYLDLWNYKVKLQYFIKHLFPDLKGWEKVF